ncbi:MAG: Asp-tRNA(Asn)/Glu-tRNA(Gln) amidotransferase subunit GatB [Methanomassiliicoccales archaeon]|jgi:aspartyl-tRNA(Asn)/glutamyl-tRNA(Gln) amidotransferase subunit B|nr:Asp-tRNA(Asn)/Glu-tRNA(Gln) amidotransferase subunit GatB [Methanomassiliicoccales archaeon]
MKIGLEIHVQLPTRSKLFCSCPTTADEPNSSVCPTCLGFPGSRPVLNRRALEMAVQIARFLECRVASEIWFSRKTYFYPDLPKHFQITQYDSPVGVDGSFVVGGRSIGIWRVHVEEDPGRIKRVGRSGEEVSLIDYNRSGIPLVEIVTAPDLTSPDEARNFLNELLVELRHIIGTTASDEQSVRADANISLGEERVEVKNVQGLKNLERALKFEASRQQKLLEAGMRVVRETRRFDEERKVTLSAREKELEEDYGYIGEPDLGVYDLSRISAGLLEVETPLRRAQRMSAHYVVDYDKARQVVLTSMAMADLFEALANAVDPEVAMNWTLGPISANWELLLPRMNDQSTKEIVEVVQLVVGRQITDSEGRRRIGAIAMGECPTDISCAVQDEALGSLINDYLNEHPQVVRDHASNPKAANAVIGHVMKVAKGKYNSQEIVEATRKEIERRTS